MKSSPQTTLTSPNLKKSPKGLTIFSRYLIDFWMEQSVRTIDDSAAQRCLNRLTAMLLSLCIMIAFGGGGVTQGQAKELTLGAVQMSAEHEWFRTVELGEKAACDESGAKLIVANARGQVDVEAQVVDDLVARGVDAIVISALNSSSSVPALKRAVDSGITLVNYNTTQLVWAANEGGMEGAISAKRTSGANIKIFGTDMSLQAANALLNPKSGLVAISTQNPYSIGYQAAQLGIKKIRGERIPEKTIIPLELYTADKPDAVKMYLEKYKSLASK
jgi:ABC-type sugar transport system substrate-binding protein